MSSTHVAIIGSACRNADKARFSPEVFERKKKCAQEIIATTFGLRLGYDHVTLVSGGAAGADHVAVEIYLDCQKQYDAACNLQLLLFLPAPLLMPPMTSLFGACGKDSTVAVTTATPAVLHNVECSHHKRKFYDDACEDTKNNMSLTVKHETEDNKYEQKKERPITTTTTTTTTTATTVGMSSMATIKSSTATVETSMSQSNIFPNKKQRNTPTGDHHTSPSKQMQAKTNDGSRLDNKERNEIPDCVEMKTKEEEATCGNRADATRSVVGDTVLSLLKCPSSSSSSSSSFFSPASRIGYVENKLNRYDPGRTANWLHREFSRMLGRSENDTLLQLMRLAAEPHVCLDDSTPGFKQRNTRIANTATFFIAFTWHPRLDDNVCIKGSGTSDTWVKATKTARRKIHVPLQELMAGTYRVPSFVTSPARTIGTYFTSRSKNKN